MDSAVFYAACPFHERGHALFGKVPFDELVVATGHPCQSGDPSWAVYNIDSGVVVEFADSEDAALAAAAKLAR